MSIDAMQMWLFAELGEPPEKRGSVAKWQEAAAEAEELAGAAAVAVARTIAVARKTDKYLHWGWMRETVGHQIRKAKSHLAAVIDGKGEEANLRVEVEHAITRLCIALAIDGRQGPDDSGRTPLEENIVNG